jgi:two-component system response regulator YesN
MNPNYLSTLFKKVTGKSFVDYLTEYRIEMAKAFLKKGDIKINDIASKVGYSNPGYFTKTFKKKVGISPQDFRKLYI